MIDRPTIPHSTLNRLAIVLLPCFLFLCTLTGCSSSTSSSPSTILGITPEMQQEIRALVAIDDPDADVDQAMGEFLAGLKNDATIWGLQPESPLPAEADALLTEWRDEGGVTGLIEEEGLELPEWAADLIDAYDTGEITPAREELLLRLVLIELGPAALD